MTRTVSVRTRNGKAMATLLGLAALASVTLVPVAGAQDQVQTPPPPPGASGPAVPVEPAAPAPTAPAGPAAEGAEAPAAGVPASPQPDAASPAATASQPADEAPTASGPVAATDVEVGDVAGTAMAHDLSPWGMFMAADWVVKGVMILLAVFSLATWIIWIAKGVEIGLAKRRARGAVRRLERASSLRAAIHEGRRPLKRGPVAALALTAEAESELSGALPADGVKERVQVALQRIEARTGRRISRGTGLLATIGSTSPFIGLFGTVWGIMNSFIGIAETNTTNLAVVAPGIAEALLATGIGLVAAIPAVIIYNAFARSIAGYRAILSDGSSTVLRHLSRDLDRRDAGYGAPAYARPAE